MGELITVSDPQIPESETVKVYDALLPYIVEQDAIATSKFQEEREDIKSTTNVSEVENQLITEIFKLKGFIVNEYWEKTININSRITKYNEDYIICECLVDKENRIFEQRSFPRYLFNHIENLKSNPYVVLSIQSKVGSTRINVLKGANIVDKKAFEIESEWEKLEGQDFNQPLEKPIQL